VADQSDGKSTSSPEAKATRDARARGTLAAGCGARGVYVVFE